MNYSLLIIPMLYWAKDLRLSFKMLFYRQPEQADCEKSSSYLGQMDEAEDSSPHDYQLPAAWDVQQYVDPI